MSLPRLDHATHITDQLNLLAAMVKTRSRASLTDANRLLETIATRFFNALFGWDLVNLNTEQANYPAADLGDRGRRIRQTGGTGGALELNDKGTGTATPGRPQPPPPPSKAPQPKRYFAAAELNPTKAGLEFTTLMQEVAQHFTRDPGTKVSIRVEIEAERPDGFNDTTVRTVSENARTLKFKQSEFGG